MPLQKPHQKRSKKYLRRLIFLSSFLIVLFGLLSQPRWLFSLARHVFPGALYATEPSIGADQKARKIVALTIDDGPSATTQEILTLLDSHNASATFFNISKYLPGHKQTVKKAANSGHEIGNHLTADTASIRLSATAFEANLLTAEAAFLPLLPEDKTLQWLRPGMGFYNAEMVRTAKRHGYRLVLGSRFPYDTHIRSSRFASAFILNTIQPGDIIVLHDGDNGRGDRTLQTLETILPALQEKGYEITTVSELTSAQSQKSFEDTK